VRCNRIKAARSFAGYLLDHDEVPGIQLVVACHHSRFALAVRNKIDLALASMLSRKHAEGEPDPLLKDPYVRAHLDRATAGDVVIIISTTNLLEAGRDLDADWCIVDPCSVRSPVQTSGRVRRHRQDHRKIRMLAR
jgi:CRISPR-associated endonuclease/helicase Cas3